MLILFPIVRVSRIFDESHDDLAEFLPKGLSAERNDFDQWKNNKILAGFFD